MNSDFVIKSKADFWLSSQIPAGVFKLERIFEIWRVIWTLTRKFRDWAAYVTLTERISNSDKSLECKNLQETNSRQNVNQKLLQRAISATSENRLNIHERFMQL